MSAPLRAAALVMALLPGLGLAHALRLTAAAAGGVVSGHVFYSDETPAAGEWVELQTPAGQPIGRVRSDVVGAFAFPPAASGTYRLVAEGEEGHRIERDVVVAAGIAPASGAVSGAASGAGAPAPDIAALHQEIRALREDVQRYEQRVRLGEVIGGIGLIVGLAGAAAWWRARPARRNERKGD